MYVAAGEQDLSRARHDLRTVVNHLEGYVLLLREEDAGWLQYPAALDSMDRIFEIGREILRVIELASPRRREESPSEVLSHFRTQLQQPLQDLDATLMALCSIDGAQGHQDVQRLQQAGERLRNFVGTGSVSLVPQRPAVEKANSSPDHSASILVVDDDPGNRELLERMLRRMSHTVIGASTGAEALRAATRTNLDLVLLDFLLPDMEGLVLLRRLRAMMPLTPVIIVSAVNEIDHVVRCVEEGAEDYFTKPFIPVLLRIRVAAALDRKRYRELLAQSSLKCS